MSGSGVFFVAALLNTCLREQSGKYKGDNRSRGHPKLMADQDPNMNWVLVFSYTLNQIIRSNKADLFLTKLDF